MLFYACFAVINDLFSPVGQFVPRKSLSLRQAASKINKRGFHTHQVFRQRYRCQACEQQFDDLSGTIFEGHHQPLRVWVLCLYLMGLNLSNEQIAAELDLSSGDVQEMTSQLRKGVVDKKSQSN